LISLQWYILVLTLRLAVYMLFGKTRSNLGKNFCILKNMHSRTLNVSTNRNCTLLVRYYHVTGGELIRFQQWCTQKIFMGGFHSVAYGGHLYLVCAVCDVTIWRHSHVY